MKRELIETLNIVNVTLVLYRVSKKSRPIFEASYLKEFISQCKIDSIAYLKLTTTYFETEDS